MSGGWLLSEFRAVRLVTALRASASTSFAQIRLSLQLRPAVLADRRFSEGVCRTALRINHWYDCRDRASPRLDMRQQRLFCRVVRNAFCR